MPAATQGETESLLARCKFPAPGDGPHCLAVSGGPDSMALVILARAAGIEGTVVHVDHGMREGSDREAEIVEEATIRFGFGFRAARVSVEAGPNLEARARRARYGALPDGVMTGHTMDDQVETVLLNLMRGAGIDGLAGMRKGDPAGRPGVRRPLLGLRRAETLELCRVSGLTPIEDPSNHDPAFRRNRVRAEVIPLLADVAGRDVVPVVARQAALIGEDADLLDALASAIDPTDVAAVSRAPLPLARRAVRAWLRTERPGTERHPPAASEVERVLSVASGDNRACQLAGGGRVGRRAGRLTFDPAGGDGQNGGFAE